MNFLRTLDEAAISKAQYVYEYFLDRFGMLIGSFRLVSVAIGYAFSLLYDAVALANAPNGYLQMVFRLIFAAAVLWFLFAKKHLTVENKLHTQGNLDKLNSDALRERSSLVVRWFVLTFCAVLAYFLFADLPSIVVMISLAIWLFSLCVLVRDRDADRFVKPKLVPGEI